MRHERVTNTHAGQHRTGPDYYDRAMSATSASSIRVIIVPTDARLAACAAVPAPNARTSGMARRRRWVSAPEEPAWRRVRSRTGRPRCRTAREPAMHAPGRQPAQGTPGTLPLPWPHAGHGPDRVLLRDGRSTSWPSRGRLRATASPTGRRWVREGDGCRPLRSPHRSSGTGSSDEAASGGSPTFTDPGTPGQGDYGVAPSGRIDVDTGASVDPTCVGSVEVTLNGSLGGSQDQDHSEFRRDRPTVVLGGSAGWSGAAGQYSGRGFRTPDGPGIGSTERGHLATLREESSSMRSRPSGRAEGSVT